MVANFLAGGAVCNAFAARSGAEVVVVDVGVAAAAGRRRPGCCAARSAPGTARPGRGPGDDARRGARGGRGGHRGGRPAWPRAAPCLLTGDMGIANTTASAALVSAFTGADAGGGDRPRHRHRRRDARPQDRGRRPRVGRCPAGPPTPAAALAVLAAVGGLEHAAMAGFLLGAAAARVPVILDGVIAGRGRAGRAPRSPDGARSRVRGPPSAEPGPRVALDTWACGRWSTSTCASARAPARCSPCPWWPSAARALHEVATFDSAGVTEKD